MSLTKADWIALRSRRAEITSALHVLGIPLVAWCNDEPEFKQGYKPDWEQIEKIATTIQTKGLKEWPPYIQKTAKVVEKAKAQKKVVKGGAKK
jgi:hypothetical protein